MFTYFRYRWIPILSCNFLKCEKPEHDFISGFLLQIKDFVFEMSDDPFEVKLRDNYELLEDEYKENIKRQKMLEEKVSMCIIYEKC